MMEEPSKMMYPKKFYEKRDEKFFTQVINAAHLKSIPSGAKVM